MGQQQHPRQQHRAEGIDVLERIEADAAELLGGVVAEPVRDKGVRGLVKGDGDDQRQDPDRDVVKGDVQGMSCWRWVGQVITDFPDDVGERGTIRRGFSFETLFDDLVTTNGWMHGPAFAWDDG